METLRMIGYMFMGSGIVAWIAMIWAVKLTLQGRLSIHIKPKK